MSRCRKNIFLFVILLIYIALIGITISCMAYMSDQLEGIRITVKQMKDKEYEEQYLSEFDSIIGDD